MISTSRFGPAAADARRVGRKLMGIFVTCGFPTLDATLPILRAVDEAGADFIELGMPFSDPLAEGKPIQHTSARALANGVTIDFCLRTASAFRQTSTTPLFLMGYVNPILRRGADNFCRGAMSAGVDGLIIPDLPTDEPDVLATPARAVGLDLVHLIAPNTDDDRMRAIDTLASGFVYAVSITGLTGSALAHRDRIRAYLKRARACVKNNPLLVGFGIRSRDDAAELSQDVDGFIVGSAVLNHIEELWMNDDVSDQQRLKDISRFVSGLRPAAPVEQ